MQQIVYSANVFHMQAANSKEHFMGFRVQVNGTFSSQQINVCVNNGFYHCLYHLYYLYVQWLPLAYKLPNYLFDFSSCSKRRSLLVSKDLYKDMTLSVIYRI